MYKEKLYSTAMRTKHTLTSMPGKIGLMASLMMGGINAYADSTGAVLSKALGYLGDAFMYVGIFLAVLFFVELLACLKRDDPDGVTKNVRGLIIGGILIGIKPIMSGIVSVMGVSGVSIS